MGRPRGRTRPGSGGLEAWGESQGAALHRFNRSAQAAGHRLPPSACLVQSRGAVLTLGRRIRELGPDGQPHAEQAALKRRASCRARGAELVGSSCRRAGTSASNVPERRPAAFTGRKPPHLVPRTLPGCLPGCHHSTAPAGRGEGANNRALAAATAAAIENIARLGGQVGHLPAGFSLSAATGCVLPCPHTLTPSMALACRSFRSRASFCSAACDSCSILPTVELVKATPREAAGRDRRVLATAGENKASKLLGQAAAGLRKQGMRKGAAQRTSTSSHG